ncbi:MAG: copper-binding protein [Azoarcus sp.]|jgi:Cu(I)/Ag(I) efflux system protein CusF|nr:copper-binding protein [Azoarcus sp.]
MNPKTEARRLAAACLPALILALAPQALAQHAHDHGQHTAAPAETADGQTVIASGQGIVKKIDLEKQRLILEHEAIAALNWPAMTMPFAVTDTALLQDLKIGDRIDFDLKDQRTISAIRRR